MNLEAARKLQEIIGEYGPTLWDDARRFEALLKDLCPQHEREVFLLACAVRQRVPADLLASQNGQPLEVALARLTRRLSEDLFLAEDAARWAVESVAVAVGIASEAEIAHRRQAQTRAATTVSSAQTSPANQAPSLPAPAVSKGAPSSARRPTRRFTRWIAILLGLLVVSASAVALAIEIHTPTRTAWHELLIYQRLYSDEAWGDLGDLYQLAGRQAKAQGCYEIARLLDSADPEWKEKAPGFSQAVLLIRRLDIRQDAWIRSLGSKALGLGLIATPLALFEHAYGLDPSDTENSVGGLIVGLRRTPTNGDDWLRMGDALTSLDAPNQAQGFYAVAQLAGSGREDIVAKAPDLDAAVPTLQALGTTDAGWLGGLAARAYSLSALQVSKTLYSMAQSMDPGNPEWSLCREAVQVIQQLGWALNTRTTKEAWNNLSDAYRVLGDQERASAHQGVARLLDPVDPRFALEPGSLPRAVSLLKSIGIRDDEWIGNRGDAALRLGATTEALEIYRWALAVDPLDSEWPGKRDGLISLERNRQTVRRDMKEDEHWGDLADAYRSVDLQQQAESCYALARLIDPDDFEWQARNPRLSAAVAMLREFGSRDDEWIGNLGDAARGLGDPGAARGLHALALELDPRDSEWIQKAGGPPAQ